MVCSSVLAKTATSMPSELESDDVNAALAAVRGHALSDDELLRASIALTRKLLGLSLEHTTSEERKRTSLLARMMNDLAGQVFTTCLTDRAYRSREPARVVDTARQLLRTLGVPQYLPAEARALLHVFLRAGPFAPQLAAEGMRSRLRKETRGVVLSAEEPMLTQYLAARREQGVDVNLNYLGEAVLGEAEAEARIASYEALLARPDVQAISIKLSSIASRVELLAFRQTLDELKPRLRRIYRAALSHRYAAPGGSPQPKLVSLDMEAYRDLPLTAAIFQELMAEPEFSALQACLVLQAYLPDAHRYQRELTRLAQARLQRGGAPLRMRIVKGANLAAERVESALRGWPLPILPDKAHVDANYRRMLEFACEPEHARALHVGVASHNLFDIALALTLAAANGLGEELEFELLEGMADALRRALASAHLPHRVLLYAPIVAANAMQTAIAYLMRRLDENTAEENFLRNSFGMQLDDPSFQRERERFERGFALRRELSDAPLRTQDLAEPVVLDHPRAFQNEPDTDFALPHNAQHIAEQLESLRQRSRFDVPLMLARPAPQVSTWRDGFDPSRPNHVPYRHALAAEAEIESALATADAFAPRWASTRSEERVALLRAVANGLRRARADLICTMVLDAGKRVDQADTEVSECIDFAEYYAQSWTEHVANSEYKLTPRGPVLVTPPWNFPLAIPAGGVFAALVTGCPVLLKPALETVWVAARLVEVCHAAGVPKEALQLIMCEDQLGSILVRDPRVKSVILTGATSTAQLFYELRSDLHLLAETGGKNSIIVSDLADRDAAIKDALASAFGHAGQKCSAASVLICLPEVYDDPSFFETLRDATESLPVGSAWDTRSVVTPLIKPPTGALLRALTSLEPGERFLVEPRFDPHNPHLIGPCIKVGVAAGSFSHVTELFGPVLAVLRADDFDHAIELANATPYGLTAGLFSLDERERARWSQRMLAGNLYVNRGITGAIVGRQPFGGWKASSFGPGAKAGGPNYVLQLCDAVDGTEPLALAAPEPAAAHLLNAVRQRIDPGARERLARAACRYGLAARNYFAVRHDPCALLGESNELVYPPCTGLTLRAAAGTQLESALQACVAAVSVGAQPILSVDPALGWGLPQLAGCKLVVETTAALCERVAGGQVTRVRVCGPLEPELRAPAAESGTHLALDPILATGRIELLQYVREQAVSFSYHRYGSLHDARLADFARPAKNDNG
jgi:RHH-type transcriptional regulator, proline utilization regulon repressor / proline dehydrogenase / delta 1-pyrroline-5-carboxylate dehydrogenase